MSIVAPVAATAPVVPVVVAVVLGEFPAPIQGAGVVLATAGIVLTSWQRHARLTAVAVFVGAFLFGRAPFAVRGADLPLIVVIGVLVAGADSMYAIASTRGLLSVVAALSSLYPVVTIGLAHVYLRERIERLRLVGIATSLCGVVTISAF